MILTNNQGSPENSRKNLKDVSISTVIACFTTCRSKSYIYGRLKEKNRVTKLRKENKGKYDETLNVFKI